jgi:hypothetical protein
MKKHYIRKDNRAVADAVFERIHGQGKNGHAPEQQPDPAKSPEKDAIGQDQKQSG